MAICQRAPAARARCLAISAMEQRAALLGTEEAGRQARGKLCREDHWQYFEARQHTCNVLVNLDGIYLFFKMTDLVKGKQLGLAMRAGLHSGEGQRREMV